MTNEPYEHYCDTLVFMYDNINESLNNSSSVRSDCNRREVEKAMDQMSFSDVRHVGRRNKTPREVFVSENQRFAPWQLAHGLIVPFYRIPGRGTHSYPLETMLCVDRMQNWLGLSDSAMEEGLCETAPGHTFAKLSNIKPTPATMTILHFRRLLISNALAPAILSRTNIKLTRKGLMLQRRTIVDVPMVPALSSTTNTQGDRDLDAHQRKLGEDWHFAMKAHVDAVSCLMHTAPTNKGNSLDVDEIALLWFATEKIVYCDASYADAKERAPRKKPRLGDLRHARTALHGSHVCRKAGDPSAGTTPGWHARTRVASIPGIRSSAPSSEAGLCRRTDNALAEPSIGRRFIRSSQTTIDLF